MISEHTSKQIIGTKSQILKGKKIALCITGSVAAVECPIIARELMRHGAEVYAVMTPAATKLISPALMEWATGNPVVTELTGMVEHISLAGEHPNAVSLVLVAPATANTISKIAYGIDDTPVTTVVTTAIGARIPVVVVPAMHESMYRHPIILENLKRLERYGIEVIGPRFEEGKAKMAHINTIIARVIEILTQKKDMKGLKVLITGGPTREYIDAVRYISNPSSGRMGVALAEEAFSRGAEVTLIYGPGTVEPPSNIKVIRVETTKEMLDASLSEISEKCYDIIICAAAVADYAPKNRVNEKIPSGKESLEISLVPLPKVIDAIRVAAPKAFLVGFKAEYGVSKEELISRAMKKLKNANLDMIVANDVSKPNAGFFAESNEVYVIDKEGNVHHIPLAHKRVVASKILDLILEKLWENRGRTLPEEELIKSST
ncbi:MAG: bifunctional phosphopantothenoylcysteine decarboxylase/phosphopantothenate--cysteine ligase CoaBC [Candidatus Jordarchaeales archaeon]